MKRVLHLLHEFPPDEIFGLGQSVFHLVEHTSNSLINHIGCISMQSFRNYQGNSVYKNLIRTDPSKIENIHDEWYSQNIDLISQIKEKIDSLDVIHCHDWLVAPCAIELSIFFKAPLISTFYTIISERARSGFLEMPHTLLKRSLEYQDALVEKSAVILTVDDSSKQVLKSRHPLSRVECIGLGIRPLQYKKRKQRGNRFAIGYLGRIAKEKGIELIPSIVNGFENIELHIAGTGGLKDSFLEELSLNNIQYKYYKYLEKTSFFGKIDLLIVPSFYDTGPLVAIEAIFAGVPVIISTECGFSKWFNGFENVFLADATVEAFRNRVLSHIIEKELIELNTVQLHKRLSDSELTINNYACRLIALYNEPI